MKISFTSSLLFVFAFFLMLNSANAAPKNISDKDIAGQIEKSLIFDEEAQNKINFYNSSISTKESDFSLNTSGDQTAVVTETPSTLGVLVSDAKVNNIDLREKERLAYNAALIEQYEVAIELYKQILKAEPDNNYVKLSLAFSYQQIKQFAQAKSLYYSLLQEDLENRDLIINNLLSILMEESPRETLYLVSRLAVQNPKSAIILANAAMANERFKNHEKAIELFKRAIRLDNNPSYKYNLAVIYDKTSDYQNALRLYMEIVGKHSNVDALPIAQIEKRIEFIRSKKT